MLSIRQEINRIKMTQRTIDEMLEMGILSKEDMHFQTEDKNIDVDILYQHDATIGIGHCHGKAVMPEHKHDDSKHYLICISGRFIVKLDGAIRVLAQGDCMAIPQDTPHTTQCIHEGKLIFVNVPADKNWGAVDGRVQ